MNDSQFEKAEGRITEWIKLTRDRANIMLEAAERVEAGEKPALIFQQDTSYFCNDLNLPSWDWYREKFSVQPKQGHRPWANLPEFLEDSAQDMWFLCMDVESTWHSRAMRVQGIEMAQDICINFGALTCGFTKLYRGFVCSSDLKNWQKCGRKVNP